MTAAAIDRFGPPSVLTLHVLPVPEVGPGVSSVSTSSGPDHCGATAVTCPEAARKEAGC